MSASIVKRLKFLSRFNWDLLNLGLITLLSVLFFYKLGQSSLVSWDEAWYGDIARHILETGNLFNLWWNGHIYSDHPPAGFWIIALFEGIFGVNEFGVRVGSAIFGLVGLYITYLLGKELFSKTVGLASAVALSSTYWYLSRARSGNLDIFLTVFFVLTFYFAVKSVKNKQFLIPFAISLSFLILTKSVIPITIFPALIVIFFGIKINLKEIIKPLITFLVITLPWFVIQYLYAPEILYKYFQIGTPGVGQKTDYLANFKQIKEYLHFGVGKWFWPGVLGGLAGPLTLNRGLLALSVFCLSFFVPFISSDRGHIWHLIPLYPFMILSFFGFMQIVANFITNRFLKKYKKEVGILISVGILSYSGYFSWIQIRRSFYEFIDIPKYISDEAILSKEASKFPYNFYIDGPDFTPAAAFYSHKKVGKLWEEGLKPLFDSNEKFVLITMQWRLDKFNITKDEYRLIKMDRDKILIVRE